MLLLCKKLNCNTLADTARTTGSMALATEPEPGTNAAAATPPRNTDDNAQTQPCPTERYAAPVTDQQIVAMRDKAVPKKTALDTMYCIKVWKDWSNHRTCTHNSTLLLSIQFNYWFIRFVLEVCRLDGAYPPEPYIIYVAEFSDTFSKTGFLRWTFIRTVALLNSAQLLTLK